MAVVVEDFFCEKTCRKSGETKGEEPDEEKLDEKVKKDEDDDDESDEGGKDAESLQIRDVCYKLELLVILRIVHFFAVVMMKNE